MVSIIDVISNNIKRLREVKNLSQKVISASSNIPQGQYSRIENGRVEPSISTLEKSFLRKKKRLDYFNF